MFALVLTFGLMIANDHSLENASNRTVKRCNRSVGESPQKRVTPHGTCNVHRRLSEKLLAFSVSTSDYCCLARQ